MEGRAERKSLIITLVHGTWPFGLFPSTGRLFFWRAKKGAWFQDGSSFRTLLSLHLKNLIDVDGKIVPEAEINSCRDVVFVEFSWSGENSIHARDAAAKELAAELGRQSLAYPHAERVVIAHSHGGNVALRAMTYGIAKGEGPRLRIATMATPFLQIFVAPPQLRFFELNGDLLRILIWSGFLVAAIESSPFLLFFYFGALAAFAILYSFYTIICDIFRDDSLKAHCLSRAAFYSPETICSADLLVVRTLDDEALLGLSFGSLLARSSQIWMMSIIPFLYFVLFAASLIAAPMTISAFIEMPRYTLFGFFHILPYLPLLVFSVAFIACLGPAAISLSKSFFGRELIWGSKFCDVVVNSVPDVRGACAVKTIPQSVISENKLRHGVYENVRCLSVLIPWLTNENVAPKYFDNVETLFREIRNRGRLNS